MESEQQSYPQPENSNQYSVIIDLNNPEKQLVLEVKDSKTGETVSTLAKVETLSVVEGLDLMIRSADAEKWKAVVAPIEALSKEEKEKLKKSIEFTAVAENRLPQTLNIDLVARAIEDLLHEKAPIPSSFYKNINPSEEFGIERFVLDRMYYLPNLIEEIRLCHLDGLKYVAQSEQKVSVETTVRFEHRFQATCDEEARKLFNNIANKQAGIWQKIWFACWLLGNNKGKFTYSCSLTELMHIAYPDREGYFAVNEKVEFYEHLKSIEQTQFVFSKPIRKPQRKKDPTISYNIPLISIRNEIHESREDKYPEQLTISLRSFEPEPHNERIYHVGAAIKNKTLELHADDTQLAGWIQTRKGQRPGEAFIKVDRDFLIKLAGLQRTDASNKTVANKNLMAKFKRLQEKGILKEVPKLIEDNLHLWVR